MSTNRTTLGINKVIDHLAGIYPFVAAHKESFRPVIRCLLEQTNLGRLSILYGHVKKFKAGAGNHQNLHSLQNRLSRTDHLLLDVEPKNFLTTKMVCHFYQKPLTELLADFVFVQVKMRAPPSFGEPIDSQLTVLLDRIFAIEVLEIVYNILLRVRYKNTDVNCSIHCAIKNYLYKKVVTGDNTPINYHSELVNGFLSYKSDYEANFSAGVLSKIMEEDLVDIRAVVQRINQMTDSEFRSYVDRIPDIKYCYYSRPMFDDLDDTDEEFYRHITRDYFNSLLYAGNGLCMCLNWEFVPDFEYPTEPLALHLDRFESGQLVIDV